MERGEGGPGLIDHCDDEISPLSLLSSSSSSLMQVSYRGHNDLCGGVANSLQITMLSYR